MSNLIELLRAKHRDDLFVAECNTGSAWSGSSIRRLDAWVMKRSWRPLEFIGYEIKSSRQDFERDLKWAEYIPFCHKFSFVCERGLIQPNDLPLGVGLLWATKDGKKLFVKVPAPRREVDVSSVNKLMTYVLMSRSVIVANMHEANGHTTGLGIAGRGNREMVSAYGICVNCHRKLYDEFCDCEMEPDVEWCERHRESYPVDGCCPGCEVQISRAEDQEDDERIEWP